MKRLLFIFNRHAGKDKHWSVLTDIIDLFTAEGFLVTSYCSQAVGDAGNAATRLAADFDRVIVAGGDGTLNEVVSGLLLLPNAPEVGYIPMGSSNDFSKTLHIPADTLAAAKLAVRGEAQTCDIGKFNGRPFLYVAAFGAFTDVSFRTSSSSKHLLGHNAYLLESVKHLHHIKPFALTVHTDGETFAGKYIFGMVSNTTTVGGFHFPPGHPTLDDGFLEVTLVSPPKDLHQLESFSRTLLFGSLSPKHPMLHSYTISTVDFHCDKPLAWSLDGENGGNHTLAQITVIPSAFQIVYGQ